MKTLVIVAHPEIKESSTQLFLKEIAIKHEGITWLELNNASINNVEKNRSLLKENQRIIFQFPLLWYSAPGILFEWLRLNIKQTDDTWLAEKELGIVVNIGQAAKNYRIGASEQNSLSSLLSPLGSLANKLKMKLMPYFLIEKFEYLDEQKKKRLMIDYLQYLDLDQPISFEERQLWVISRLKKLVEVSKNDKLQLILNNVVEQKEKLDELKNEIKLIKEAENNQY